jgi:hypothetical protein
MEYGPLQPIRCNWLSIDWLNVNFLNHFLKSTVHLYFKNNKYSICSCGYAIRHYLSMGCSCPSCEWLIAMLVFNKELWVCFKQVLHLITKFHCLHSCIMHLHLISLHNSITCNFSVFLILWWAHSACGQKNGKWNCFTPTFFVWCYW